MVRELLHQFPVQMGAIGSVLVHIDAHWKDTNLKINHADILIALMCKSTWLIVQVEAFSNIPVQTTFEPLPWLFSAER